MVIAFIDDRRDRFGVEPICRVLRAHDVKIAPSTYYAAKTRPVSARALRAEIVLAHIVRVHESPTIGRQLYGARKVDKELAREEARGEHPELGHVPCCQVERLMRANGLRGVRRRSASTAPSATSHPSSSRPTTTVTTTSNPTPVGRTSPPLNPCRFNRIECDHGRLKARLRPMRGLKTDRTAPVIIRGHAFVQNLRRGHYELGVDTRHCHLRHAAAFDELTPTI